MASSAAARARRRASKRFSIGRSVSPMTRWIVVRSSESMSPWTVAFGSAASARQGAQMAAEAATA
jgi:hypothetical protein